MGPHDCRWQLEAFLRCKAGAEANDGMRASSKRIATPWTSNTLENKALKYGAGKNKTKLPL